MKLIITENEGMVQVETKPKANIEQLLQLTCTAILGAMRQVVSSVPEADREECQGALYDMYNIAASRTLEAFAPELELRPNLTTQAILEAENKILLEGRVDNLQPGS